MAKATRTETHIPDNERPINVFIHKKTTHFHDMVENTNEFQKYTEEQYEADLQKWFNDTSFIKKQTNWTEKYAHEFKQWSGEIKTSSQLLESNANERSSSLLTPANIVAECNSSTSVDALKGSSIQKTTIMSATPINTENLDITKYIEILLPVHTT